MPLSPKFAPQIESVVIGLKENYLREEFTNNAVVTNIEKGYVSVPFVNQLIDLDVQGLASDLIAYKFRDAQIDKVVMIPNSGNPLATTVAERLGVPLAVGRKGNSIPSSWKNPIVVTEEVNSFTTDDKSQFVFNGLDKGDRVLIIDDVIAHGGTFNSILKVFKEKGINVVGIAVYFAKLFQPGVARITKEHGIDPFYVVGIKELNEDTTLSMTPPHF